MIRARAADQDVVVVLAEDPVIPAVAEQRVVPRAAGQIVGAASAGQEIIRGIAGKPVAAIAAYDVLDHRAIGNREIGPTDVAGG